VAGLALTALGGTGEAGGGLLDATGVGAVLGVPLNVASAGAIIGGVAMTAGGGGGLAKDAAGDDRVEVMRTDHTGASDGEFEPTDGFRGSEYSQDEIEQFVNGHTGDRNPTMDRPSEQQVNAALTKGTPERLPGQNAEQFDYNGVRVIVNYDMPWRSTAFVKR
jgi:hypothetical protein